MDVALDGGATLLGAVLIAAAVTAVISWVLSTYPVLSRRRSLAHQVTLLVEQREGPDSSEPDIEPVAAAQIIARLVEQIVVLRGDLVQFPITYYFRDSDPRSP